MLITSFEKVGVGKWIWLTWDHESPNDTFVRGIVTNDMVDAYAEWVTDVFGKELAEAWSVPRHLFKIEPSTMASQIPGIFNLAKHPVNGLERPIHEIIIDLNDSQGWTRESIADWLETLDNQPVFKLGEFNG